MKTNQSIRRLFGLAMVFSAVFPLRAQTVYFLMNGPVEAQGRAASESYLVGTSDAQLIQQARTQLRTPGPPYLVPHVRIATGADAINRNYADPDRPAWPWHVTELIEWTTYDPTQPRVSADIPNVDGAPSSVPQLLSGTATQPAVSDMTLIHYPLAMEITPEADAVVVNVSARAWVGTGERLLITGFIVVGRAPKNVVIRALGRSLVPLGVQDPLSNPRLTVYRDHRVIAENDEWGAGNFVPPVQIPESPPPWYAWLFPTDASEAALQLSLVPGTYTVHVRGVDDATGVALADVHDLDALNPQ